MRHAIRAAVAALSFLACSGALPTPAGAALSGPGLNAQFDGYAATTTYDGPIYNVWATFPVEAGGIADWVAAQASTGNTSGFFQAGVVDGACFWASSALDGSVAQFVTGPRPGDCAVGHTIEVLLYVSAGSGASVWFTDESTGDEWAASGIPVQPGPDYCAQFLVEENSSFESAPEPFPTFDFGSANTELDNYIFGSGSVNAPLYDFAAFGLAGRFLGLPGITVSPVSTASAFSVT